VVVGPRPPNATFRRSRETYILAAPGKLMPGTLLLRA